MKLHNFLPLFLDCLRDWRELPTEDEFVIRLYAPMREVVHILFDDAPGRVGGDFYSVLEELDWQRYREAALGLSAEREEARVRRHLAGVEELFGFRLEGEIVLFSSFECMDGYARFDRGSHRVFLGVDESHAKDPYLDILMTHELTHVARESRPGVWEGFGLDPKMTHDEFTDNLPVIEHLMNEGFACAVSEILVPGKDPWLYGYQDPDGLSRILRHPEAVDRVVHRELERGDGDYGHFYNGSRYSPRMPVFAHYVWAWQWQKKLLAGTGGGDARRAARELVGRCSRELVEDALEFRLGDSLIGKDRAGRP